MNELTDSETVKKISREIIDYLMSHPNFPHHKITNLKGKIEKRYKYHKVIKTVKKFEKMTIFHFFFTMCNICATYNM